MTRLGKFLVQEGILSSSDQQMIRRESVQNHGSFARSILAMGLLDEDELSALFASKTNFRQASKNIMQELSYDCKDLAPLHIIAWLEVLPLVVKEGTLTAAMVDPTDPDVVNQLEFFTGLRVKPVIATRTQILNGLKELGATLEVGESRFEAFLKTHSRMSETIHKKRAGAKKRLLEEDDGSDDMTFDFETSSDDLEFQDDSFQENLEFDSGADLENPGLAAIASDELVSDANMGMTVDMPAELADDSSDFDEESLGDSSGPNISIEAELPDFAADLGDEDPFAEDSGEESQVKLSSDAPSEDKAPNLDEFAEVSADPTADEPHEVLEASGLEADQNLEVESTPGEDFDVDVSMNLGSEKPLDASMLPGGLEDEVVLPSEEESHSSASAIDIAEMDSSVDDFNLQDSTELSSEFNEILHDAPEGVNLEAAAELPELSETIPDIGAFDQLEAAETATDVSFSEPNILEESLPTLNEEPTVDISSDASQAGIQSNEIPVQKASEPVISATSSGNLVGAPHTGVAVLNRALVQLQMASDSQKVLNKLAETASKVGINGGAIFKCTAGDLKPGIMWHKEGGKFGSIPQLPSNLNKDAILALAAKSDLPEGWAEISEVLGKEGRSISESWPLPESAPNFVLLRRQGDEVTFVLAEFKGSSDHDGLKQSFADVIRAVSAKI